MNASADDRLIDRAVWRIMPLATLSFVAATIDKSNIGFAKLEMIHSLHMSEAVFAFGSSLFFVAFLLFEIPSALAAHRYGASRWIARIMATWGATTILLAFTSSMVMFYGLRILLGVAEAGLYPALLYYLTLWFPQAHQARVAGFLTVGSALGNGSSALISGPLLDLNGAFGFAGWQWIFLVTGAVPLVITVLVLRFMPDRPAEATFLSAEEKARLIALVEADKPVVPDERHVLTVLGDWRVLGFGAFYLLTAVALFGVIYWTPTAIRGFGVSGTENGLLTAAPWAVAAILLLTVPRRLKSRQSVLTAVFVIGALGAVCFASAAIFSNSYVRYATLLAGTPCISLSIGLFWTFPVRLFDGARAAAAIAAINVFGNVGGFLAQNLMPAVAQAGGSAAFALWVPSACLAMIGIGAAAARLRR